MKLKNISTLLFLITFGAVFLVQTAEAQTREDVVLKFNEGFELVQAGQDLEAIEVFEETLELAEAVGDEADDIRDRVRSQIPQLSFRYAGRVLQEQRDIEGAIEAFQEAIEYADRYDSPQIRQRAEGNLPRLHLTMGNQHYRNEDFDAALASYNEALELNPQYPRALYQKGLVYRQQQDLDQALENFDAAISLATEMGDNDMINRSRGAARDYLVFAGAGAIENENYDAAVALLNRALGYDDQHAETYYRLAEAYNHQEMWDQALDNATVALQYETGGRTDQAKIWFELGIAYKHLDNEPEACEAFQNAAFGQFQTAAEYELEHELNCPTAGR